MWVMDNLQCKLTDFAGEEDAKQSVMYEWENKVYMIIITKHNLHDCCQLHFFFLNYGSQ